MTAMQTLREGLSSSRRAAAPSVFALLAIVLAAAPLLATSSLAISVLSQIGYSIIICLSFNMLFGQGGMLSFGHAVYSGLGAFAAVHCVRLAAQGQWPVPLVLVPVVGGLAGLIVAALLGFICTRRAGTTFAMITLGVGELVAAMALMFPQVFGGEGGIGINRVYGAPFLGLTFASALQVYYLIAVYCMLCGAAMYFFTGTALGRMLNAVRDNPARAEFIGYDPRRVRHLAFMLSGFFAGVGGALMAIHLEIVTGADSLGLPRSGAYLLFTFLGGAGYFFGPVVGAVLMVCSSVLLSHYTQAWLLYLGLAFVLTVMFAPGGVAAMAVSLMRAVRDGRAWRGRRRYVARALGGVLMLAGACTLVEMLYHLRLDGGLDPTLQFMRLTLDVGNAFHWAAACALALLGLGVLAACRRKTGAA